MTNIRVAQDLLEHQHRLEEEEATRKRNERLEQDIKSSKEKFEEVKIERLPDRCSLRCFRSFAIGKELERKKFRENYTK